MLEAAAVLEAGPAAIALEALHVGLEQLAPKAAPFKSAAQMDL